MSQLITEHFTIEELTRSAAALRLCLDNTLPAQYLRNAERVALALEKIRAHFGKPVRVTSCYRSKIVNAAVGGSLTSAHCMAMAADFEVIGVSNLDVCRAVPGIIPDYDQVIYEFGPGGWVHLGLVHRDPRGQQLTAIKVGGKTVYKPGILDLWKI
ncbi:MAG: ATP-binding protein [Deltaproteobacteria bacterium HGW-Deltaproteobacteria-11]|nr:MAG: ATP-binding protein [Deltaproteobacteria bacterium HGW-Deltaproteobacteria-11]